MDSGLRDFWKELKANKKPLGVAGILLVAVIVLVAISQTEGGSKIQTQTTSPEGKVVTTTPVEALPSVQILAGEVVAHQGKNSFSFHFPTTWSASMQQNTAQYITITLTPPAVNGVQPSAEDTISFQREQQDFLDLAGIKTGYFGGVGTSSDYYKDITLAKTTLGGAPAYYLASTAVGTPLRREVYFTLRNYKSYAFTSQALNPTISSSLAPVLKQISTSLKFES
jgi:hypothetical protein